MNATLRKVLNPTKTDEHRFGEKLVHDPETDCLLWTGGLNRGGYARFSVNGVNVQAHRWAYGEDRIPEGLHLDHLCRVRHCQNPAHLEPVTNHENLMRGESHIAGNVRKTHCPSGHPYSGDNLILRTDKRRHPYRVCRHCFRKAKRIGSQKRRDARRQSGGAMNTTSC